MSNFLKIFGVIYITISVIIFFLAIKDMTFWGTLSICSSIVLGVSTFTIGELMERVSTLESQIGKDKSTPKKGEESIQQVICPNCKTKYDIDYPNCPHCGSKNTFFK